MLRPRDYRGIQARTLALAGLLSLNLMPWPRLSQAALAGALGWALVASQLQARRSLALALGLAWAILAGIGLAWMGDPARGRELAVRMAVGASAGLAFAWGCREAELRELLRRWGLPSWLLELLDRALLQGRLLMRTLARRQEASRLRQGGLPGSALALAGGVERAFTRGEALEAARSLREASLDSFQASSPALQLRGVTVRHPDGGGLEGLELELAQGEWLAVLGASGSGKSTLLRVASGLLKPSEGNLRRFGREGAGILEGRTALVFQDPEDQLLAASALEDAAWGLERRGVAPERARERAAAVLEALGLGICMERVLHRLSHGERKRAALASALVLEPDLLLLDEPTAGLDACAAARMVALLEAEVPRAAVLWATHDLQALPGRVRRVLLLEGGRAAILGSRSEALEPARLRRHGLLP